MNRKHAYIKSTPAAIWSQSLSIWYISAHSHGSSFVFRKNIMSVIVPMADLLELLISECCSRWTFRYFYIDFKIYSKKQSNIIT